MPNYIELLGKMKVPPALSIAITCFKTDKTDNLTVKGKTDTKIGTQVKFHEDGTEKSWSENMKASFKSTTGKGIILGSTALGATVGYALIPAMRESAISSAISAAKFNAGFTNICNLFAGGSGAGGTLSAAEQLKVIVLGS